MDANTKKEKIITVVNELSQGYIETSQLIRTAVSESANSSSRCWQQKNKPTLIKVGLALIAFPDPTISDIIGTGLVAAGLVQQAIKSRAIHTEDIGRSFQTMLKEMRSLNI